MSKELKITHYVGTVKTDCSEEVAAFTGLKLFIMHMTDEEEALILGALTLEDIEKFYRASYEAGMKEVISDDYEYCIWYLADSECELTPRIKLSDLENLRDATQDDANEFDKSFDEFKKVHKFAEREQAYKEQEEKENIAVEEFKKLPKQPISVAIKIGETITGVQAVIYKDFATHDPIDAVDPENAIYKTITVIKGKGKGMKLLDCNVTKYKKCIDEIREVIGDKELEISDLDSIKPIVKKYR